MICRRTLGVLYLDLRKYSSDFYTGSCLQREKSLDEIFWFKRMSFSLRGEAIKNVKIYQQSMDNKPLGVWWFVLSLVCNLLSPFSLGSGYCSTNSCFCEFRFTDSSAPFSFFCDTKVGRLNDPYVQFTCKISFTVGNNFFYPLFSKFF